jgi:quinol monooxygenase YgiN
MSTHVVNEFHALPDRADDVMNLLIELSPISRTRPGCQALSVRRNQDDPGYAYPPALDDVFFALTGHPAEAA